MKIALSEEALDELHTKDTQSKSRKAIDFATEKVIKPVGMGALAAGAAVAGMKPVMNVRDVNGSK